MLNIIKKITKDLGSIKGFRMSSKVKKTLKDILKILGDDKDDNKTLKRC